MPEVIVIVMFHVFSFRIVRSYFKCSPRLVAPGCSLACGEHMFTSRAMVKQISRAMFDVIGFKVNSIDKTMVYRCLFSPAQRIPGPIPADLPAISVGPFSGKTACTWYEIDRITIC